MEINQVLAQMRAMSLQAQQPLSTKGVEGAAKTEFSDLMQASLDQVTEAQSSAKSLATAFESGDTSVELPEVMVALQKANVSFQAITQVRNKLLNAYQEVMNMQV
ncbi:MAG: flagellar hook-basal body complex protein FliE [Halioglobus sp.]